MIISERKSNGNIIVEISGRLDANNSPQLQDSIFALIEKGEINIIIDFGKLDYISSSGLRVLLMGAKKLKGENKMLNLARVKEHIHEVFDIAGFTPLFNFYDDLEG